MTLHSKGRTGRQTRLTIAILIITFLAICLWAYLQREPEMSLTGQAFVQDGDSLRVAGERVRLTGLDAPEYEQTCQDAAGNDWPCGIRARDALAVLVQGAELECRTEGRDVYERALARCTISGRDIAAELVAQGWAVADGRYRTEEETARLEKLGIWQGDFERPAQWRESHREVGPG